MSGLASFPAGHTHTQASIQVLSLSLRHTSSVQEPPSPCSPPVTVAASETRRERKPPSHLFPGLRKVCDGRPHYRTASQGKEREPPSHLFPGLRKVCDRRRRYITASQGTPQRPPFFLKCGDSCLADGPASLVDTQEWVSLKEAGNLTLLFGPAGR